MSLEYLKKMNGKPCACGKSHSYTGRVVAGKGVLSQLPEIMRQLGGTKAFVLTDQCTYKAAGEQVCNILHGSGFSYTSYSLAEETPEPDEKSVGAVAMHFDHSCDVIVGVGSGVINDLGKILSALTKKPYLIVATAPSMDGYASATSSMTRDGLKISLPSRGADVILGDTKILCQAPLKMMKSGLGDMIAKYVSICEWRLAHLITGEYYCEEIANLVRVALKRCVDNAPKLLQRDETAVQAVFEGLVIGGVAMNYAGLSRPASGVEHYISHVLDMRGVEFGLPVELHGIQCAVGTLEAVKIYEKLKKIIPDREKALAHAARFDYEAWSAQLRNLLGNGAKEMIALEAKEQKYNKDRHSKRLETILQNWDEILKIIEEELPSAQQLEALLDEIDAPKNLEDIGVSRELLPVIFRATADIRDKYVLSRLTWDLGVTEELV